MVTGYGVSYALFVLYYILPLEWITYRTILLSGDVERNPGPSLNTWNVNSITLHDLTRMSQTEAYNSIFNYDLIRVVEIHLDSTVEKTVI